MSDEIEKIIDIIRGLDFFSITNVKGWYILASYHHPDSLTWRWSFSYYIPREANKVFPKGSYIKKKLKTPFVVKIPFVGAFAFSKQKHTWKPTKENK